MRNLPSLIDIPRTLFIRSVTMTIFSAFVGTTAVPTFIIDLVTSIYYK